MTISSMTGFAAVSGSAGGVDWTLEARSVNGRGLDVRSRLGDGFDALEPALRGAVQGKLSRGSVQIALKLASAEASTELAINRAGLDSVIAALAVVAEAADARGVALRPARASDVLAQKSVVEQGNTRDRQEALSVDLKAAFPALAQNLATARQVEGAALADIMSGQLDRVEALVATSKDAAGDRQSAQARFMRQRLAALLDGQDRVDEDRLAQELALIAVKSDVSEEIDRLGAHVAHARELLAKGGAVGRKLDFLMQEFNREANTLCSKSQDSALTEAGLELKVVIDQMREQAANIE